MTDSTVSVRMFAYVRTLGRRDAIDAQTVAVQAFVRERLGGVGDGKVHLYRDFGAQAFSNPLWRRTQGSRLCEAVQEGDHVVFVRLDEAFQSFREAIAILEEWKTEHIRFHDTTAPVAEFDKGERLILARLRWAAKWQAKSRRRRTEAANHDLMAREGRHAGGKPPWYLKLKTNARDGRKFAVLDDQRVALMFAMRRMRDEGKGYQEIAVAVSKSLDPAFEPTPYTEAREYPISRAQVHKLLQPEGWRRFVENPLLQLCHAAWEFEADDRFVA